MWSLKSVKDASCLHYFLVGKEYAVGRKNVEVLLVDDLSISRRHAVLSVTHPIQNVMDPTKIPELKLKDAGSKYGTFKNGSRLEKDEEVVLQSRDIVKFGQFESSFEVCYTPLVITTSCVPPSLKNELKQVIHKLGGHLIPEWRPCCTHLIMSGVKVTVKALCCLMSLKHIISPEFLVDLTKSFVNKTSLPHPKDYLPPINEPMIDKEKAMFSLVEKRKNLFKNKKFIFLDNKQMKKFFLAISMGGATALVLDEDSTLDVEIVTDEQSCVVQPIGEKMNNQKFSNFMGRVTSLLQSKKKRMIPESDFGLAVAYSSVEKFCNPDFCVDGTFVAMPNIPSQSYTQAEVYVPDTEERKQNRKRFGADPLSSLDEIPLKRASSSAASAHHIIQESEDMIGGRKRSRVEESPPSASDSGHSSQSYKRIKTEVISDCASDTNSEWDKETQPNSVRELFVKPESIPETPLPNSEVDESPCLTDFTLKTNDKSLKNFTPGDVVSKFPKPSSNLSLRTNASGCASSNFRSKPIPEKEETSNVEEDLPKNLIKIAIVDLVKPREPLASVTSGNGVNNANVKNFKKFKKVVHAGANSLPKIIGGRDLVIRSATSSKAMDDWLRENVVENASECVEEDAGEFDWDFPKKKNIRGR